MNTTTPKLKIDGKCMVCGAFTELRVPLTFCDKCRHSPEADKIRAEHKRWFDEIVAARKASSHTHKS